MSIDFQSKISLHFVYFPALPHPSKLSKLTLITVLGDSYRNSQQDPTAYQNLLFHVYLKLNMFRATHRPSSGAKTCTSSHWYCLCERLLDVVVFGRWQSPTTTTSNNHSHIKNQWLLVQFLAPDDGRCVARNMLSFK